MLLLGCSVKGCERTVFSYCVLVIEPRLHAAVGSGHLLVRVSMPLEPEGRQHLPLV